MARRQRGIATGRLLVIDVYGATGRATLAELEHAHTPLPATLAAHTGRGEHLYFDAAAHRLGTPPAV